MTYAYNALMLAVVAGAVLLVRWRNTGLCRALCIAGIAVIGLMLGLVLARGRTFLMAWLWCHGLFIQGPAFLLATAVLSWRTRRRTSIVHGVTALLMVAVAVDGFMIEPTWLDVSHVEVRSPRVVRPVRIAVVADIQADEIGSYERRVLQRVLDEKPDVILLLGDYIQVEGAQARSRLVAQFNAMLREMKFATPGGVYAVGGNIDPDNWAACFDNTGVTVLPATETFSAAGVRFTALSPADSWRRDLAIERTEDFHVVFGHHPDYALGPVQADLLLAGHTHGGQVQLPFIGPLVTLSGVPRSWAAGVTDLPGGQKLIVSRGVGMERMGAPRIRFLCRPELVIVDILPATPSGPPAHPATRPATQP